MEELVTDDATRMNGVVTCRVLVTGANGFIGSVVTALLAEHIDMGEREFNAAPFSAG